MRFDLISLEEFEDDFESAEVEDDNSGGGNEPIPDGIYQVTIDKISLDQTQAGVPMLKWMLRIIGPKHKNRCIFKNSVFSQNAVKWIKQDLHRCGLKIHKLSELKPRLEELLDVPLEIRKVTSGQYENVYINKRIELPGKPDTSSQSSCDDLPF